MRCVLRGMAQVTNSGCARKDSAGMVGPAEPSTWLVHLRPGYPLAGCSPAEPASVSPGVKAIPEARCGSKINQELPVRKAGKSVAKEGPFSVQRMGSTSICRCERGRSCGRAAAKRCSSHSTNGPGTKPPTFIAWPWNRRFGIETSYRQKNQAQGRTTSKDPIYRLLLEGLGYLVRQMWVALTQEIARRRDFDRNVWVGEMPMQRMSDWILRELSDLYPENCSIP